MKPINTGTADFADLIKNNAIYVDKTAYIHRLVSDANNRVVLCKETPTAGTRYRSWQMPARLY